MIVIEDAGHVLHATAFVGTDGRAKTIQLSGL